MVESGNDFNHDVLHAQSTPNQEYADLKRFIFWVLATLLPLTAISVAVGIISDSLTALTLALDSGTSLVLHSFNMVSIIVIMRRNHFNFPYGTGKLENFSGLMYALLVIPVTLCIIATAVQRYRLPPSAISFGLAQIPLILSITRASVLLCWASHLCKRYPNHSPMSRSYYVNFRLTMVRNLSIVVGLLLGSWLVSSGHFRAALAVDLILAVSVAVYMFHGAVRLLAGNFMSLIDLPLPEPDQYKILKALVMDYDSYEGVGNIYSKFSGSVRFVQIELYFNQSTTMADIDRLRGRIEQRLMEHFSKLVFHLIPLVREE